MSQPPGDRVSRYTTKVSGPRSAAVLTTLLPGMRLRAHDWFGHQAKLRAMLVGVLGGRAVVGKDYGRYMAFVEQLDKALRQGFSGTALMEIGVSTQVFWVGRGLDTTTCTELRIKVMGIPAPAGP